MLPVLDIERDAVKDEASSASGSDRPPPVAEVPRSHKHIEIDAVLAAAASASSSVGAAAAAEVIRNYKPKKCMLEIALCFKEQEDTIQTMGWEIAILRQELCKVKAIRFDLCSCCARKFI